MIPTTTKRAVLFALLGLILFLQPAPAQDTTYVGGPLFSNTVWTRVQSPYVVQLSVVVNPGVTLTVEPGVTVLFRPLKAMQVSGVLIARGTSAEPILFGSARPTPTPGDWDYLRFNDTSADAVFEGGVYAGGCILEWCTVEYAGRAGTGAVQIASSSPFLYSSTIRQNAAAGIHSLDGSPWIKDCQVRNNTNSTCGGGISLQGGAPTVEGNRILGNSCGVCAAYSRGLGGGGILVLDSDATVSGNVVVNNSTDGDGAGICFANQYVRLVGNSVNRNAGEGIGGLMRWGSLSIERNIVYRNEGPGISLSQCSTSGTKKAIRNNVISENGAGGLWLTVCDSTWVEGNAVIGNRDEDYDPAPGIYLWIDGPCQMGRNTIYGNRSSVPGAGAIIMNSCSPVLDQSNIFGNPVSYAVRNQSPYGTPNVHATGVWWGTTDGGQIEDMIYHWFDDGSVGMVDYYPWLPGPSTQAPVPPPPGLAAQVEEGGSIRVSWSSSTAPDVAGYKVYYDINSGHPYTGTDANEGPSPIDVGLAGETVLTGLDVGATYFVAVTAYDWGADGLDDWTDGTESWFAAEDSAALVPDAIGDEVPPAPDASVLQIFPNPARKGVWMSFTAGTNAPTALEIVDASGRMVRRFTGLGRDGASRVWWDGRNAEGRPVSSGVYICRMLAGTGRIERKFVLL